MQRHFIRPQSEQPAGKSDAARSVIDDNSLDRLLQDCGSTSPGQKMPNTEALGLLRLWHATQNVKHLNAITVGNIRLLLKCAHRYQCPELPIGDLVHEAAYGFTRGLKCFDLAMADRGPVANYAAIWARKQMLLYIDEHGRCVRLSVRTVKAAKKGLKKLEQLVAEHEHTGITLDYALSHRPPSERIGALDYFNRSNGLEYSRPRQDGVLEENHSIYNETLNSYSVLEMQRHAHPPCDAPAERPGGDEAADRLYLATRALPEHTRQLVYAYYGVEGGDFDAQCISLGLDASDARAIVRRAISQMRALNAPR